MTMDHQPPHPDDERLAAFASGDGEVSLAAHVDTCDRCTALVADLASLRASLAALPDLVPSRPLRYLPPVAAAPAAGGFPILVRRLFAPAMTAGAALVLMGSVGMAASGSVAGPASTGAEGGAGAAAVPDYAAEDAAPSAAAASEVAESFSTLRGGASPAALGDGGAVDSLAPGAAGRDDDAGDGAGADLLADTSPSTPWLAITIAGAVLLAAALILRWTIVPRAPYPPTYPGA